MFKKCRNFTAFIAAAALGLYATAFSGGLSPALAQDSVQIQFEPGATSTTINGTIIGNEYIDYVLGAQGGQTMVVSLAVTGTNGNGSAFFNILPAGQDYPALFNGSNEGQRAEVTLPSSGNWAIRVYLMGNDADTGKTVGFSIDVYIAPGSGSQGAASSGSSGSGLLPEEDFFVVRVSGGDVLNVRQAPRASAQKIGEFQNGRVLRNAGGCTMSDGQQWCNVQASDGGVIGWVSARFLRLPGPGDQVASAQGGGGNTVRVHGVPANDVLNVRSGPGTGNRIVGALANGDNVTMLGCQNVGNSRWCEIEMMSDMRERGWVNARYLQ
ncbi:SH3 domain-containing protein [Tropicimonas sediminicola]|uniref:SH3 domain-containing protein n=1 Tax=Tropicimonas sediminicola TaxID=1031541 RepID=A0A239MG94_9RHOB|nr:SH3 domain-containing protein [Tropicimonas sediminicola]SNT41132.1 SH3 domain-containing protein [Tropicimonas sediminicola]